MLRNYFVTAFRILRRQKLYSFINILGLSVGLAASLLIFLYISDELRYDRHIKDAARIYRVGINETFKGDEILYSDSGAPLAEAIRTEIPEVEASIRVSPDPGRVKFQDKVFIEKKLLYADSNFFEFFGYSLLEGNVAKCLKGPDKIVVSASAARKYFGYRGDGDSTPLGKQLIVGMGGRAAEVTGIFADVPATTHMKFDMVMSMESLEYAKNDCWACYGTKTYFKTVAQADMVTIEKKLDEFAQKKIIPRIEKDLHIPHEQFVKSGDRVSFFIQPLLSIHLESNIDSEFEPNGDLQYVYIFSATGIFLILMACINFMNLSTARAVSRSKEVGVRKTMGATRQGLVPQFMLESFLYVLLSALAALVIAFVAMGPFNMLSGKDLKLDLFVTPYLLPSIFLFLVIVGLLAGTYPAFYLTSFNPVRVLKGGLQGSSRSMLRSTLVIFQFTISIVLIVGTVIIYKQVRFIQNHQLGFNKENVIRIPQTYVLENNAKAFKDDLLRHSEFVSAAYAQSLPPYIQSTAFIKAENSDQLVGYFYSVADHDLLQTMGYEMKSGRYFSREFRSDSSAVIINEACARLLGFETHEGKRVSFGDTKMWNVIGIIKDFNFASLKSNVQPLALFLDGEIRETLALRLAPGNPADKVALIESVWKKYANGQPFQYAFIDEDFSALFRSEQRLGIVFATFTIIAILIACLGLFGLITYIAAQRTKEIGIRKVLGATLSQITILLLSDLVKLVLIAFAIAIPLAWYGMDQWLQSFAYRIPFDIVAVIIAGAGGILIAILTVVYRSIKAASVNPVDSLKNE
jgi:putative ABC transport system permease protein